MFIQKLRNSRFRLVLVNTSVLAMMFGTMRASAELPAAVTANFSSGGGTYSISGNGKVGTIDQQLKKEIFRWQTFNISNDSEVIFRQPGKDAIALNRIYDMAPSKILGKLTANGSVYLINRNGIMFGDGISTGQVNVGGSFLATTMDFVDFNSPDFAGLSAAQAEALADQRFLQKGLLEPFLDLEASLSPNLSDSLGQYRADWTATGSQVEDPFTPGRMIDVYRDGDGQLRNEFGYLIDASGNLINEQGDKLEINVGKNFVINVGAGKDVLLVGPTVTNAGEINTTDGGHQILVGAQNRVFLVQSGEDNTGTNLGNILVEVETGGEVTNIGNMIAERGKVTLLGMAVNQKGTVRATTTVNDSGTIRLIARDGASMSTTINDLQSKAMGFEDDDTTPPIAAVAGLSGKYQDYTGTVTVGADSVTEVVPTTDPVEAASEVADAQEQRISLVNINAENISIEDNARITATGGKIAIEASNSPIINPFGDEVRDINSTASVDIAAGAILDVSGAIATNVDMSKNELSLELRGNELADSPLQRDSVVNGADLVIDRRYGTPLGDISKFYDGTPRTVAERLAAGGKVDIKSKGSVNVDAGATIDIEGGYLSYKPGVIQSTKLIEANGAVVDIRDASPDKVYTGIANSRTVTDERWGVTKTYYNPIFNRGVRVGSFVEGKAAGEMSITARNIDFSGSVKADEVVGPYQTGAQLSGVGAIYEDFITSPGAARFLMTFNQAIASNVYFYGNSPVDSYLDSLVAAQAGDVALQADSFATAQANASGYLSSTPEWQAVYDARFSEKTDELNAPILNSLQLSDNQINRSGLRQLEVNTKGEIIQLANSRISMKTGSEVKLTARGNDISLAGAWRLPGGKMSVKTVRNPALVPSTSENYSVTLEQTANIDTSGLWINNLSQARKVINARRDWEDQVANALSGDNLFEAVDGGSVTIEAFGDLQLKSGSAVRADGGAMLARDGSLTTGDGGSIKLQTQSYGASTFDLGAELSAYGFEHNGSLDIVANDMYFGSGSQFAADQSVYNLPDETFVVESAFFDAGKFQDYSFTANRGKFIVAGEFNADIQQTNLQLNNRGSSGRIVNLATGADVDDLTSLIARPAAKRNAVSLALTQTQLASLDIGDRPQGAVFTVESGAEIKLDTGSELSLAADSKLLFDGVVRNKGGDVNFDIILDSKVDALRQDQGIWLGANSLIDVSAAFVHDTIETLFLTGKRFDAGSINFRANRGFVATMAGSQLDVSGGTAVQDLAVGYARSGSRGLGLQRSQVAMGAGEVNVVAAEGIFLEGDMRTDVSTVAGARGAALSVALNTESRDLGQAPPPKDLAILLRESTTGVLDTIGYGGNLSEALRGQAQLGIDKLNQMQLDKLVLDTNNTASASGNNLESYGVITFDGVNTALNVKQQVSLDAVNLNLINGATATVNTAFLSLGNANRLASKVAISQQQFASSAGNGSFTANADLIDLVGNVRFSGDSVVTLNSRGDIRGRNAVDQDHLLAASLDTSDSLNLNANRIYPTTLSSYAFNAPNTLSISGGGQGGGNVLSALGEISFNANDIQHAGTVLAPFGVIIFNGTHSVSLDPGSLSSVSGAGQTVSVGRVAGEGEVWVYAYNQQLNTRLDSIPEKKINVSADNISWSDGATMDISGGGSLQASEFIPGPFGSGDMLQDNDGFAIVPAASLSSSAYDYMDSANAFGYGEAIELAGVPGLKAGVYIKMPKRYALLPGAWLMTPTKVSGNSGLYQETVAPLLARKTLLGGWLVSGRDVNAVTDHTGLWNPYVLERGSNALVTSQSIKSGLPVSRLARGQYYVETGDNFFSADGLTERDAGSVSLDAGSSLTIDGILRGSVGQGGLGSRVDIAGNSIRVVKSLDPSDTSGAIQLVDTRLNDLGVSSLLIGGTRELVGTTSVIHTRAQQVEMDTNTELSGSEVLLSATDDITLKQGAQLRGEGIGGGQSESIELNNYDADAFALAIKNRTELPGNYGALLRVSSQGKAEIQRPSAEVLLTRALDEDLSLGGRLTVTGPTGNKVAPQYDAWLSAKAAGTLTAAAADAANLTVEQGATVYADSAIALETSNTASMDGSLLTNGALTLVANQINLGENLAGRSGLNLDQARLSQFNPQELEIVSRNIINVVDELYLAATNLTLSAPGMAFQGDGSHQVTAAGCGAVSVCLQASNEMKLVGSTDTGAAPTVSASAARMSASANTIVLADGGEDTAFSVVGVGELSLSATSRLTSEGNNRLQVSDNVVVDAPLVKAGLGSRLAIEAGQNVLLTNSSGNPVIIDPELGGDIALRGDSVNVSTSLSARGSNINIEASNGDVTLANGARLDVSGSDISFLNQLTASVSAGDVQLSSRTGDVRVEQGAEVDISANSSLGESGSLSISAESGDIDFAGQLAAFGNSQSLGGAVAFISRQFGQLSGLLSSLTRSGVERMLSIRATASDLVLGAQDMIAANRVRLQSDSGVVSVDSAITASGDNAEISVLGKTGIVLGSASVLSAVASNNTSGSVRLQTDGTLDWQAGSQINFSSQAQGDVLTFSLPVVNDQIVGYSLAGTQTGAESVVVEGRMDFGSAVTNGILDVSSLAPGIDQFYALSESTLVNDFQSVTGSAAFSLVANAVVDVGTDISIANPIDFAAGWYATSDAQVVRNGNDVISVTSGSNAWRFGANAAAAILTLRSTGDILIESDVSDGFADFTDWGTQAFSSLIYKDVPITGDSWSFHFIAGANSNSVELFDTVAGQGNIVLGDIAAPVMVRTGTGDIKMAAGGSLISSDAESVIYTGGKTQLVSKQMGNDLPQKYFIPGMDATIGNTLYFDTGILHPSDLNALLFQNLSGASTRSHVFPTGGGDVEIDVGGDVQLAHSDQLFTAWQMQLTDFTLAGGGNRFRLRSLSPTQATLRSILFSNFQQGIGALGGGNVTVSAGGDIANLSVSTPTTTKQIAQVSQVTDIHDAFEINGGGDITVSAGGDIKGLKLLVENGQARIQSDGDLTRGDAGYNSVLALSNASIDIETRGDANIDAVANTTMLAPAPEFAIGTSAKNYYFTYRDSDALRVTSTQGDVYLNQKNYVVSGHNNVATENQQLNVALRILPPTLEAYSLNGDINLVGEKVALFPSADGQLSLVAAGDIAGIIGLSDQAPAVRLLDVDRDGLPYIDSPVATLANQAGSSNPELESAFFGDFTGSSSGSTLFNHSTDFYRDNGDRSLILAGNDIYSEDPLKPLQLISATQTSLMAGNDLKYLYVYLQHNTTADKSVISAGGSLDYSPNYSSNGTVNTNRSLGIQIAGPGSLDVLAGEDILLGASAGIVSLGDFHNPVLPEIGASIRVVTGLAQEPDYQGFINQYLQGSDFAFEFQQFLNYRASDAIVIGEISSLTGDQYASREEALSAYWLLSSSQRLNVAKAAFNNSSLMRQRDLVFDVLTAEVQLGGVEKVLAGDDVVLGFNQGNARAFNAISTLFPTSVNWDGEVSLISSTIQSRRGGNVELFVPGGGVDVGLANSLVEGKGPAELGIQAQSYGNLAVVASGDINVNASRVLALDGGNLLLWSSNGNIDAGRGAKTALSIPQPDIRYDPLTQSFVQVPPTAISGSGIQAADIRSTQVPDRYLTWDRLNNLTGAELARSDSASLDAVLVRYGKVSAGSDVLPFKLVAENTNPELAEAGAVFIFAPGGVIDAGDAGISAQGRGFFDARSIKGADNIDIGGVTVGIPTATNVGASISGVGDAVASASEGATGSLNDAMQDAATSLAENAAAFVTVDIIGVSN